MYIHMHVCAFVLYFFSFNVLGSYFFEGKLKHTWFIAGNVNSPGHKADRPMASIRRNDVVNECYNYL